jgi:hypothetical protein
MPGLDAPITAWPNAAAVSVAPNLRHHVAITGSLLTRIGLASAMPCSPGLLTAVAPAISELRRAPS